MNDLIKVNYDNAECPTVSGRELHEALEVKTAYKDWFPRMCEYINRRIDDEDKLNDKTALSLGQRVGWFISAND
ncbi:antA/AntB antirepressor family protein [uncultured Ruminococcus sp.]|uniref:antA/AntB antirepressor family protein n=1 Tax=uncultured Ruminococcus sp. TaxID=165186 RepID=UPI00338F2E92